MPDKPPVARVLTALAIPHRVFRHPGPVHSLEQAAAERAQTPDQVVRSLLFRLAADEFVMVLVTGERQVAWPALRRLLGASRITMATPEEVLAVTGYPIGAVGPVGLARPVRVLADASVLAQAEVSVGSGERSVAVILATADLVRAVPDLEPVRVA